MRRHSDLHQSTAISAVLLVLLFALPLAVVVPVSYTHLTLPTN